MCKREYAEKFLGKVRMALLGGLFLVWPIVTVCYDVDDVAIRVCVWSGPMRIFEDVVKHSEIVPAYS